jgi:hypothetical protein
LVQTVAVRGRHAAAKPGEEADRRRGVLADIAMGNLPGNTAAPFQFSQRVGGQVDGKLDAGNGSEDHHLVRDVGQMVRRPTTLELDCYAH